MKIKNLLLVVLFCFAFINASFSQSDKTAIKSKVLLSITRHINWPISKSALTIGVLANNEEMYQSLLSLVKARKSAHQLHVELYKSGSEAQHCDILYVEKAASEELLLINDELYHSAVIITEKEMGQPIALLDDGKKIYFQINHEAIDKLNVHFSDNLLALGTPSK